MENVKSAANRGSSNCTCSNLHRRCQKLCAKPKAPATQALGLQAQQGPNLRTKDSHDPAISSRSSKNNFKKKQGFCHSIRFQQRLVLTWRKSSASDWSDRREWLPESGERGMGTAKIRTPLNWIRIGRIGDTYRFNNKKAKLFAVTCSDKAICSGGIATLFGALATSLHWNIMDLQTGAKMSSWLRQRPSTSVLRHLSQELEGEVPTGPTWPRACHAGSQDLAMRQGNHRESSQRKEQWNEMPFEAFWDLSSNRATQL